MDNTNLALQRYEKELYTDPVTGVGYITLRGLARLCDVDHKTWGRSGRLFTREIDETLAKYGLGGGDTALENTDIAIAMPDRSKKIPDTIATIVIKHYAYKGKEKAQAIDMVIGAAGLRIIIQKVTGWTPPARRGLTPEELVNLCVLPVPTAWERRFPVEYYEQLERLTNLKPDGYKRPQLWAKPTKELVYDYLPSEIYIAVKECKEKTGSWDKLHQFLSSDGIQLLETHQQQLLLLMKASSSMDELNRLLNSITSKTYQLQLSLSV